MMNKNITITKEEISSYEPAYFTGKIVVVNNHTDLEKAIKILSKSTILGFDTETRPAFKKGLINKVALIQLSTEKHCFLFRLNLIGFPKQLSDILCNPEILKIGLSLKDDFASLKRISNFEPKGFLELQTFVKKYSIGEMSLQKIFAILFKKKISKSQRLSNWEAENLTEAQKRYAATDAWACRYIYEYLNSII